VRGDQTVVVETREILSCRVAGTEFGLPMVQLREVVDLVEIVRVQRGLSLAEGIINYRGSVIPVVDARKALGLPPRRYGLDAHIVIADAIERPGSRVPLRQFVSGIAKLDDRLLLVLDLESVLAQEDGEERADLGEAGEQVASADDLEDSAALLRQRALELSRPVEQGQAQLGDVITMVCFTLSQGAYAIRTDFTREIVTPPPMTPIPCTTDSILGAVNIRGVIMPVVGLASMLGLQQARPEGTTDARIVVGDVDGALLGLFVDRVLGIVEVNGQDIVAPLSSIEMQSVELIEGEFDHDERAMCAIDVPAIVRAVEALHSMAGVGPVNGVAGTAHQGGGHG